MQKVFFSLLQVTREPDQIFWMGYKNKSSLRTLFRLEEVSTQPWETLNQPTKDIVRFAANVVAGLGVPLANELGDWNDVIFRDVYDE